MSGGGGLLSGTAAKGGGRGERGWRVRVVALGGSGAGKKCKGTNFRVRRLLDILVLTAALVVVVGVAVLLPSQLVDCCRYPCACVVVVTVVVVLSAVNMRVRVFSCLPWARETNRVRDDWTRH